MLASSEAVAQDGDGIVTTQNRTIMLASSEAQALAMLAGGRKGT